MMDELYGKIMRPSSALATKNCSYLRDNSDKDKKAKVRKAFFTKEILEFEDYKHCLEATQLENNLRI